MYTDRIGSMRIFVSFAALMVAGGALAQPRKVPRTPQAIDAGRAAFAEACSACHGPNAEGGHGPGLISPRTRRASDQQLFTSIRDGVPGTEMLGFKLPEQTILHMIAFLRSLTAPAAASDVAGDAAAGQALFFGKAGCSGCHMIRGQGGFLGPDLSEAGSSRTVAQLRESLLHPNARLTPGFESVILRNGRSVKGVAKHRTNYSMQVLDADGSLHMLRGADMSKVTFEPRSWMPSDYAQRLASGEIQNLLAFLSRQSIRGVQP